jgi:drug/metabolite transporter (DMT)-like permease
LFKIVANQIRGDKKMKLAYQCLSILVGIIAILMILFGEDMNQISKSWDRGIMLLIFSAVLNIAAQMCFNKNLVKQGDKK